MTNTSHATYILAAAREGRITAVVTDAETIPPLARDSETYPTCTISLRVDGDEIRSIRAWKCVYWVTGNDPVTGRQIYGDGEMCVSDSDGATHGCVCVTLQYSSGPDYADVEIETGEGMGGVESIDVSGLDEDDAEEIMHAIRNAIDEAYSDWDPEHADDEEIYDVLCSHSAASDVSVEIVGETVKWDIYAGTHCGRPVFAIDADDDKTIYDSASDAAHAASERLRDHITEVMDSDTIWTAAVAGATRELERTTKSE